ncbi:SulP family inorganic anion transporter [Polymorphobacter sp.]|uniref:SulP family inorganic anion transporter n=1 Tax=Polymorphobacter sp. TaxID=1909290 RepID=UPI003F723126
MGAWRTDLPASIVVALVALPLCLGVAVASGAPPLSGLIAGIMGGLVVGALSRSALSVSGPAAGLTAIVFTAIETLPTYEAFLLSVCLAGLMQLIFSVSRGGYLAEFVPSSVVIGMLSAIGLILILKQLPYALGYIGDYEGSNEFFQRDGSNTFTELLNILSRDIAHGALLIALASLAFLFWWDKNKPKEGPLKLLPGPLVVVVVAVLVNTLYIAAAPTLAVPANQLVQLQVTSGFDELAGLLRFPDTGQIGNTAVWTVALTLAIVASLESLLSIKAVDEIDRKRRVTDKNREMLAQGVGNFASGLVGGLPVTSVIVRSSANVEAGADSKLSTMLHGFWLLLMVVLIPTIINLIPLSALAAILIQTGYKLAKPSLFIARYKQGYTQFIPFVVTVVAILFTDLLIGIGIGLVVGFGFVIARNFRTAISYVERQGMVMVRARRDLYFIHKPQLQEALSRVPDGAELIIDLSSTSFVDLDNIDIINGFIKGAPYRDIRVLLKGDAAGRTAPLINAPQLGVQDDVASMSDGARAALQGAALRGAGA